MSGGQMWTTVAIFNRVLVVVGSSVILGCNPAVPPLPSCDGCVLLSGARGVAIEKSFDGRLVYRVKSSPPDRAIDQIRAKLKGDGWVLEASDPLNGSVEVTARWREVELDHEWVWVWSEAWKNGRGDVVWYRYTHHARSSGDLEVQATFFRKERVEIIKGELGEAKKAPTSDESPRQPRSSR
jgi:hypothetical protein